VIVEKIVLKRAGESLLHFASKADSACDAFNDNSETTKRFSHRETMRRPVQSGLYRRFGKRVFDTVFVLATLPFWLPIIIISALALWREGGTPFYSQERIGRDGRVFRILKLRTMVKDADAMLTRLLAQNEALHREWQEMQKLQDDPRTTPIGRVLRATSLDELPQLLNVLVGHMSLIGPRPMMPEQLSLYGDAQDYFALRPGVTGLWQVTERNSSTFQHRRQVDRNYNCNLTLGVDISILAKTVRVVMCRTGR
jgi:lipopolysaccharide/colanic/teichoic acid biosynthesis glycosyltransferase